MCIRAFAVVAMVYLLACAAENPRARPSDTASPSSVADVTRTKPFIRGHITSREPHRFGVRAPGGRDSIALVPQAFVEGDSGRAAVFIGDSTRIIDHIGRFATEHALVVGTLVTVWVTGPVLLSSPPMAGATVIRIEPRQ